MIGVVVLQQQRLSKYNFGAQGHDKGPYDDIDGCWKAKINQCSASVETVGRLKYTRLRYIQIVRDVWRALLYQFQDGNHRDVQLAEKTQYILTISFSTPLIMIQYQEPRRCLQHWQIYLITTYYCTVTQKNYCTNGFDHAGVFLAQVIWQTERFIGLASHGMFPDAILLPATTTTYPHLHVEHA